MEQVAVSSILSLPSAEVSAFWLIAIHLIMAKLESQNTALTIAGCIAGAF